MGLCEHCARQHTGPGVPGALGALGQWAPPEQTNTMTPLSGPDGAFLHLETPATPMPLQLANPVWCTTTRWISTTPCCGSHCCRRARKRNWKAPSPALAKAPAKRPRKPQENKHV